MLFWRFWGSFFAEISCSLSSFSTSCRNNHWWPNGRSAKKPPRRRRLRHISAAHVDRVIGAHPTISIHFPYEGVVHPITLSMCRHDQAVCWRFSFYRRSPGAHRPFSRTAGRLFVHLIGPAVEDFSIGCSAIWLVMSTLALYRPHLLNYEVTLGRYIATRGPVIATDGGCIFFRVEKIAVSAPPGWCTHRKGGRDMGARTFSYFSWHFFAGFSDDESKEVCRAKPEFAGRRLVSETSLSRVASKSLPTLSPYICCKLFSCRTLGTWQWKLILACLGAVIQWNLVMNLFGIKGILVTNVVVHSSRVLVQKKGTPVVNLQGRCRQNRSPPSWWFRTHWGKKANDCTPRS